MAAFLVVIIITGGLSVKEKIIRPNVSIRADVCVRC